MGQLGHQREVQRGDAGGGGVQAGGFRLCAERYGLLAARPFHGAGFHLCHDGKSEPRSASAIER